MDSVSCREAVAAAGALLSSVGIDSVPVDVFKVARDIGVRVMEKPDAEAGVSGALIKLDTELVIAYATHITSPGFQRFSIGHELGHLNIPGHADALLPRNSGIHQSGALTRPGDKYEREADEFSAHLLMPTELCRSAQLCDGDGLSAILELANACQTSLLAAAIRFVELSGEAMAIVVSEGQTIRYAFLSGELKAFNRLTWLRRDMPLPMVPTAEFNRTRADVLAGRRVEHETPMGDWFGGQHSAMLCEEVIGLGQYGRTLTVLTSDRAADEDDEDAELEESWTPRFNR